MPFSSTPLQVQLAVPGTVALSQFCQLTRSSLQPGTDSTTRCPQPAQYSTHWSDSSTLGQPERSCARHCSTQPLSTDWAAVQRGEVDVAFSVTDGLLSGERVQL